MVVCVLGVFPLICRAERQVHFIETHCPCEMRPTVSTQVASKQSSYSHVLASGPESLILLVLVLVSHKTTIRVPVDPWLSRYLRNY